MRTEHEIVGYLDRLESELAEMDAEYSGKNKFCNSLRAYEDSGLDVLKEKMRISKGIISTLKWVLERR